MPAGRRRAVERTSLLRAGPSAQASGIVAEWWASDLLPARFPAALVLEPLYQPIAVSPPRHAIGSRMPLLIPVEQAEPTSRV
jgi:hypothetical protein